MFHLSSKLGYSGRIITASFVETTNNYTYRKNDIGKKVKKIKKYKDYGYENLNFKFNYLPIFLLNIKIFIF